MNASPNGGDGLLTIDRRGPFWFGRLNRPDKRNALSEELIAALAGLCTQVADDLEARALVLWGAGGHFCAGGDFSGFLRLMAAGPPPGGEDPIVAHNRGFGAFLEQLTALPVPTLAVVRGAAMGGGCGLAAACDRVLAADDAVFAMPEVTLGVAPAQIAPFVVRRVGATRGRWLMLGGAKLRGAAALRAGIADVVVPPAALAEAVRATLAELVLAEPASLRATKRVVQHALQGSLGDALDGAALEFAGLLRHGAAREGIAATAARRAPAWRVELPDLPDFT